MVVKPFNPQTSNKKLVESRACKQYQGLPSECKVRTCAAEDPGDATLLTGPSPKLLDPKTCKGSGYVPQRLNGNLGQQKGVVMALKLFKHVKK